MSPSERHCVVRSRNSCQSLKNNDVQYEYEDVKDKSGVVFVHQPQRRQNRRNNPPPNLAEKRRHRSCMNRFCTRISNFFRQFKSAEGYGSSRPLSRKKIADERSVGSEGRSHSSTLESCPSEDREYIIYLPRVSRSKVQKDFIEPLQKGHFEPIILRSFSKRSVCRKCSTCHSCLDKELVCMQPSKDGFKGCAQARRRSQASQEEFQMKEKHPSFGNKGDISNKLNMERVESEAMSKTQLMYVPSKSGSDLSQFSFPNHEKNISWEVIQQRHDTAFQNQQRMLEEKKGKFLTYFEIWARRRLIADMKKALSIDKKSCICPPPNMLESRFHHIHWLGNSRSHNMVGRYFDKEENNVVALKIFGERPLNSTLENLDNKLMAMQEIQTLARLEHRNIVKLIGYFELHDKYHLILESCDHSLRDEIEEAVSGLGTSASKKIIKYILNGLYFCHQAKCLHRDLSPENILMCKSGLVKICDFDRSIFVSGNGMGRTSPTPGSFPYNSPEVLAGDKEYGLPSDVWSLGIIFCELLTGSTPWKGTNSQAQLREIHNSVGPLLPRHASVAKLKIDDSNYVIHNVHNHAQLHQMFTTISAACSSFIMKCLDVNPLCRFTCGELLQHPFIKGHHKSE